MPNVSTAAHVVVLSYCRTHVPALAHMPMYTMPWMELISIVPWPNHLRVVGLGRGGAGERFGTSGGVSQENNEEEGWRNAAGRETCVVITQAHHTDRPQACKTSLLAQQPPTYLPIPAHPPTCGT